MHNFKGVCVILKNAKKNTFSFNIIADNSHNQFEAPSGQNLVKLKQFSLYLFGWKT